MGGTELSLHITVVLVRDLFLIFLVDDPIFSYPLCLCQKCSWTSIIFLPNWCLVCYSKAWELIIWSVFINKQGQRHREKLTTQSYQITCMSSSASYFAWWSDPEFVHAHLFDTISKPQHLLVRSVLFCPYPQDALSVCDLSVFYCLRTLHQSGSSSILTPGELATWSTLLSAPQEGDCLTCVSDYL